MIVDIIKVLLFSKCYIGDGFSSVGAQMGAIKLSMAGTQDWWC